MSVFKVKAGKYWLAQMCIELAGYTDNKEILDLTWLGVSELIIKKKTSAVVQTEIVWILIYNVLWCSILILIFCTLILF